MLASVNPMFQPELMHRLIELNSFSESEIQEHRDAQTDFRAARQSGHAQSGEADTQLLLAGVQAAYSGRSRCLPTWHFLLFPPNQGESVLFSETR